MRIWEEGSIQSYGDAYERGSSTVVIMGSYCHPKIIAKLRLHKEPIAPNTLADVSWSEYKTNPHRMQ